MDEMRQDVPAIEALLWGDSAAHALARGQNSAGVASERVRIR